ncbi:MAG TPA: hypothetical protein VFF03_18680 [Rhodocyclaceae bacterium]|nr:hypothetical protein [Rhodocyclaceae bacterium]
MSGFENYPQELSDLDREIHHYAAVCGVDIANRAEVEACLKVHHEAWADDKARETLHGLLILRIKVETEMLEHGMTPPPLRPYVPPV